MSNSPESNPTAGRRPALLLPLAVVAAVLLIGAVAWAKLGRRRPASSPPTVSTAELRTRAAQRPSQQTLVPLTNRLLSEGDAAGAVEAAKQLVALDPNDAHSHNLLGVTYGEALDEPHAAEEFNTATRLDPRLGEAHENLGRIALYKGDAGHALAEYDLATNINPHSSVAWQGLGEASIALKRIQEATDALKRAIAEDPRRPHPYALLGVHLAQNSDGLGARPYLDKALAMGYESEELYTGLAMAYADQPQQAADQEKAIEFSRRGEEMGGHSSLLYYARGLALQHLARFPDAIKAYERTLKEDNTASGALIGISQCYRALGQREKANDYAVRGEKLLTFRQSLGALEREIQSNPARLDLREKYAQILMNERAYLKAADQYRYIARHRPNQPKEWLRVADVLEKGGKTDLARQIRANVLKLSAQKPDPS